MQFFLYDADRKLESVSTVGASDRFPHADTAQRIAHEWATEGWEREVDSVFLIVVHQCDQARVALYDILRKPRPGSLITGSTPLLRIGRVLVTARTSNLP